MKSGILRSLDRHRATFATFSAGQKVVAVIGSLALLLAGFLVFRWAAAPSYAPLYTNLSSADAAAVVEQLQADGVPYEITGGGGTITVPQADVYSTRIAMSGEGLPAGSGEGGYALLDDQDISTSQFKEQTDFKRAMEGELATTIEAIDGVETAVVHLALPPKEVFVEEQDPATASVLVATTAGSELGSDQVQAIVHLVASSVDGLDPSHVTVADSSGRVLSTPGEDGSGLASSRTQQLEEYQDQLNARVQGMLDEVLGAGNSTVQVTAVLDFDKAVTESTTYGDERNAPALSESTQQETYSGGGDPTTAGGVVGPDAQMETGAGQADGSYSSSSATRDLGIDKVVEQRETAPGAVESLHAAVVVDVNGPVKVDAAEIDGLVSSALGIDPDRGDTLQTSMVPFDRTTEEANASALEAAAKADSTAQRNEWIRNGVLALVVVLLAVVAWLRSRKRNKARQQATTYVVEQLRQEQAERAALRSRPDLGVAETALALQAVEDPTEVRDELAALVERQPDEVAALLRGWLVERS